MTKIIYRISNSAEGMSFDRTDLYDGVILNGKLSASQIVWTRAFLSKIKKEIFIDPQTPIYAIDINNISNDGDLKQTEEKYLRFFGVKAKEIVDNEKRVLNISDFLIENDWNDELIQDFCKNLIKMQKFHFRQSKLTDFFELVEEDGDIEEKLTLGAIIPPYFYFETPDDEWYKISLHLAQTTRVLENNYPIFPVVCFDKDLLLNPNYIDRIIHDYKEFDQIFIFISDFDENKLEVEYLSNFISFLEKGIKDGLSIVNSFGDFFSFLLMLKGLMIGFSRGICYGSKKDVMGIASGGGGPLMNRYYFPLNHRKLVESKARTIISHFPTLMCSCNICSEKDRSDADSYFSEFSTKDYKFHFLETIYGLKETSYNEIIEFIKDSINYIENNHLYNFGLRSRHLKNWLNSLNEL